MPFELPQNQAEFLVHLARNTVKTYLEKGKTPKPPADTPKNLFERCGVFVTISSLVGGSLRLRSSFDGRAVSPV